MKTSRYTEAQIISILRQAEGPVDRGVVKARLGDPRLQVVGHDLRRYTPEEANTSDRRCSLKALFRANYPSFQLENVARSVISRPE